MADVVVTVPKNFTWEGTPYRGLRAWCDEGDCAGDEWSGVLSNFHTGGGRPAIAVGERVYIVCEERLRGYAPLVELEFEPVRGKWGYVEFWRGGGAVAVTIDQKIVGFRGWRYRWWKRSAERAFPNWRESKPENHNNNMIKPG